MKFIKYCQVFARYFCEKGYQQVKLSAKTKPTFDNFTTWSLVDFQQIKCTAGSGGNGCLAFTPQAKREFAGPDGGDGGNGGHVIFKAVSNVKDLSNIRPVYIAPNGKNGRKHNQRGKDAKHFVIEVPIGTTIKDAESQTFLCDLLTQDQIYIACHGGSGGHGNYFFVNSTNTVPKVYELGAPGESKSLILELKTIADIGLIGFPNAGKSTLLRALTRARPKVAPYPFTTLRPHVGIIEYLDTVQISVADIPGLVEDAHLNKGLGFEFLRHIERCHCFLYVIDMCQEEPWIQLDQLKFELNQYQSGLAERPNLVLANKTDTEEGMANFEEWQAKSKETLYAVSALKAENIHSLYKNLRSLVDNARKR